MAPLLPPADALVPASPAALRDELGRRTADQLAQLLTLRPDLAAEAPEHLDAVLRSAVSRASLHRASLRLDRAELDALERALVLGPDAAADTAGFPGLRDRALVLSATPHASGRAEGGAAGSVASGSVTGSGPAWRLAPGVQHMLGRYPAGLGRPARQLPPGADQADPARLADGLRPGAVVDLLDVPAPAREVLERFARRPVGSLRDARRRPDPQAPGSRPVDWLLARGLLLPVDDRHVEAPLEVGLALRPDPWGEHASAPPVAPGPPVPARLRDNASAAAVEELVRDLRGLRAHLRLRPLEVLRAGDLGVRARRRLAAALETPLPRADRLLGYAQLAGLVAQDDDGSWRPSAAPFEALGTGAAHALVLACWWASDLVPTAAGTARPDGSTTTALSDGLALEDAQVLREAVVAALAAHAPAAPDPDQLLETALWLRPRVSAGLRLRAEGIAQECADLGLTGAGAATDLPGLLLAGGPEAASRAVAARLAPPVETVILQDDLTASAPGTLSPAALDELSLLAEPEGRGAATTFRLTQASLHRAMDAGHDAASLARLLARRSQAELPGVVLDALREAQRTHGSLRVLRAEQVLTGRADLIEAMASSSALRGIETVRVSPEVLILREPRSDPSPGTGPVASALRRAARAAGVQPAQEPPPRPPLRPVEVEETGDLLRLFPVPAPRHPRPAPADIAVLAARLAESDGTTAAAGGAGAPDDRADATEDEDHG